MRYDDQDIDLDDYNSADADDYHSILRDFSYEYLNFGLNSKRLDYYVREIQDHGTISMLKNAIISLKNQELTRLPTPSHLIKAMKYFKPVAENGEQKTFYCESCLGSGLVRVIEYNSALGRQQEQDYRCFCENGNVPKYKYFTKISNANSGIFYFEKFICGRKFAGNKQWVRVDAPREYAEGNVDQSMVFEYLKERASYIGKDTKQISKTKKPNNTNDAWVNLAKLGQGLNQRT